MKPDKVGTAVANLLAAEQRGACAGLAQAVNEACKVASQVYLADEDSDKLWKCVTRLSQIDQPEFAAQLRKALTARNKKVSRGLSSRPGDEVRVGENDMAHAG